MTAKTNHFTVHHDGVTIPVSRGGRGRPMVLCPGLLTTQFDLRELTELLRRDHDVMTFDLRGHGLTSSADRYSFEAFLGDFGAVMAELERLDLPSKPVLVGHSLGADLIVRHTSEHPNTVAELVLIDGGNPVPEPFISKADLPEFRAMAEDLRHETELAKGAPRQVLLTPQEILDRYRKINLPISMIMSTWMAGNSDEGRTPWRNQNWRAGVERLVRERPHISVSWLDADHSLVVTHAPEIARIIRSAQGQVGQATS